MAEKFQNKYRSASARLKTWDYGWNGAYFVSICTQSRECFFGNISDGKMHLSEIGEIAHNFWIEIPNHFPFVKLGEFIVMPNHMHGIIIIDKLDDGRGNNGRDVQIGRPYHYSLNHERHATQNKQNRRKKRTMETRNPGRYYQPIQTGLYHQCPKNQSRIRLANPILRCYYQG
ncbi:hypothetical protein [Gillisia limnaea]|uniref:Transposase IS200-like domain-containing protein n=1 Tax=Gillisia limnaea (strain DSM 15749 / LMG 21470 / R-8282) TaxID=865937 RepID=H2BWD5_GILLR|nr:hypothetical protein [Gillisia limnaea]EHQ01878.1 hypothetical protein Gilli_1207 [Gillisia limnaea DSM 15749]